MIELFTLLPAIVCGRADAVRTFVGSYEGDPLDVAHLFDFVFATIDRWSDE